MFFIYRLLILIGIFVLPKFLRKEIVLRKLPIETIVLPVSNWKMFFVQVMVTFGMFVFSTIVWRVNLTVLPLYLFGYILQCLYGVFCIF